MNRRAALVFLLLLTALLLLASFWLWRHHPRPATSATHGAYPAGQERGAATGTP